jgi:hypothetical protein
VRTNYSGFGPTPLQGRRLDGPDRRLSNIPRRYNGIRPKVDVSRSHPDSAAVAASACCTANVAKLPDLLRRVGNCLDLIDELFGLKMGADDFIRKPFSQRLLAERVKVVLRRASPKDGIVPKEADSKVLERGQLRMDPERHTCTWKNELVTPSAVMGKIHLWRGACAAPHCSALTSTISPIGTHCSPSNRCVINCLMGR